MDQFSLNDLRMLMDHHEAPCVSIFMPMRKAGRDVRENPIRLKNLLTEAEEELIASGLRSTVARELLAPARERQDDPEFWQSRDDGLAMFASPDTFRYYRLPVSFEELTVVSDRFHIKPLIPLLTEDGRFYILALSQNDVRLLQATQHSVSEIVLKDVPRSMEEALWMDNPEKQLQFRSGDPGFPGRNPAQYHGQGGLEDSIKTNYLRFFQRVDRALQEQLGNDRLPMVIASVEYLLPIYREASSYPNLLDEAIAGSPDRVRDEDLRDRAWTLLEPRFIEARNQAKARYRELAGTGHTSNVLRDIVPAAQQGRVDTLFVATGIQRWGRFDRDAATVTEHEEEQPGDDDLLNLAAVYTLLNGGKVYAVPAEEIPDNAPLAAILRY